MSEVEIAILKVKLEAIESSVDDIKESLTRLDDHVKSQMSPKLLLAAVVIGNALVTGGVNSDVKTALKDHLISTVETATNITDNQKMKL